MTTTTTNKVAELSKVKEKIFNDYRLLVDKEDNEIVLTEHQVAKLRAIRWLRTAGQFTTIDDMELMSFIDYCVYANLNPILGEVFLVSYGSSGGKKLQALTSYSVYLRRAEESGDLEWYQTKIIDKDANGQPLPQVEWVAVTELKKKSSSKIWSFEVYFTEFSTGQSTWKTKPRLMLEKCSISNAIRKAFPLVLKNMPYTIEEYWNKSKEVDVLISKKIGDSNE